MAEPPADHTLMIDAAPAAAAASPGGADDGADCGTEDGAVSPGTVSGATGDTANHRPAAPRPDGSLRPDGALRPGQRLGRFEVRELLGRGGMGAVYRAHDPALDRDVALKVLTPALARDPVARGRFAAEGRAAGRVSHPHIVAVHEVGLPGTDDADGGPAWLVMDLVTGGSVQALLDAAAATGDRLDPARATAIVAEAAAGLGAAHDAGLVHRDVKPANLMLDGAAAGEPARVKVADFGLALRLESADPRLTQGGRIVGTPHFMSPEQCAGRPVDARGDLYSLGATYHALLTGRAPFAGEPGALSNGRGSRSAVEVLTAHVRDAPPAAHELAPGVPPACTRLIARAMAKAPDDRYPCARDLRADAEALLALLSDPATARTTQYRGAVSCPRDAFVLPSERSARDAASGSHRGGSLPAVPPPMNPSAGPIGSVFGGLAPAGGAGFGMSTGFGSSAYAAVPVGGSWGGGGAAPPVPAPPPGESIAGDAPAGSRREVFSLDAGEVVLVYPTALSTDDADAVRSWLRLLDKKLHALAARAAG